MKPVENERDIAPDAIRLCAMTGVIVLHVADDVLINWGKISASNWWTANIFCSVTRISVPLFLMLSGMLLLGKDEPPMVFYKKRLSKIAIPFLSWSCFYLLLRIYVKDEAVTHANALKDLFTGGAFYHLWFMFMIIWFYALTPAIRVLIKHASLKWIVTATAICFSLMIYCHVNNDESLLSTLSNLGYFIFGYAARNIKMSRLNVALTAVLFFIGVAMTAAGTGYATSQSGYLVEGYMESLSPNVILASTCFFLIVKNLGPDMIGKSPTGNRFVFSLSAASFGIYLMHPLVLLIFHGRRGLGRLGMDISAETVHPAIGIPLTVFLAILICYYAVIIMKKIPLIRYVA